jgi:hypothetical protein
MTITLRFRNDNDRYGRQTIRYDITHTDSQGNKNRKFVSTGIKIKTKDVAITNWRVKKSNPNQQELNKALESARKKIHTALNRFETKQFTYNQVVSFLKGEIDYGSVDKYINSVIKESRTSYTYNDYKAVLNAFKKHLDISREQEITFSEFSSYETLDRFKRKALNKGIATSTINSYFNKIRAVLNDAYNKGYIYEKFTLQRGLKVASKPSRKIVTITSAEFENALMKIDNIYDAQALALYLLMFGLRGMYLTDIVALKDAEYKCNDFNKKDPYEDIFNDGYKYIIHRRVKTKNSSNDDLIIRLDRMIPFLINNTKKLFKITHKSRGIISKNKLALFDYDLTDNIVHKNIWDVYQRRIKKLLGYSYQTARKTYNTFATELEVSNTIKDILLGHAPQSINERHYVNRRTIKISEKVQQAHTEIMEDFKFEKLAMILYLNMVNFLSNKDKKTAERIILSELFQGQTLLKQYKNKRTIK